MKFHNELDFSNLFSTISDFTQSYKEGTADEEKAIELVKEIKASKRKVDRASSKVHTVKSKIYKIKVLIVCGLICLLIVAPYILELICAILNKLLL